MHPDVDLLCLLALGEDAGTEDDRDHARTCAACSFEVSELHRVAAWVAGRWAGNAGKLLDPGGK